MIFVVLALAVVMMFTSTALVVYNAVPPVKVLARRGRLAPSVDPAQLPSLIFRILFPLLDKAAPLFKRISWPAYRARMGVNLRRAGIGDLITVNHLFPMKILTAIVIPYVAKGLFPVLTNPALYILATAGAAFIPEQLVTELRKAREHKIVRTLPGAVDVLSLSVEAGLEFQTALQRLVERGGMGPLRDELTTILNDIRLGMSRADALKGFASRVEITEVSAFVSVLVQADMLGASIGPVLHQQAVRMRVERFQRAEKAGARATQKILFPLVLFIFPAVLIVVIGPVALQFVYGQ